MDSRVRARFVVAFGLIIWGVVLESIALGLLLAGAGSRGVHRVVPVALLGGFIAISLVPIITCSARDRRTAMRAILRSAAALGCGAACVGLLWFLKGAGAAEPPTVFDLLVPGVFVAVIVALAIRRRRRAAVLERQRFVGVNTAGWPS